jgi:hypothetical protein
VAVPPGHASPPQVFGTQGAKGSSRQAGPIRPAYRTAGRSTSSRVQGLESNTVAGASIGTETAMAEAGSDAVFRNRPKRRFQHIEET